MRCLLLGISLLLLLPPTVYSEQQYTEGACILLQQQIDRFSQHKQNSNYRSATREYNRFCNKPVQVAFPGETTVGNNTGPGKPAATQTPPVKTDVRNTQTQTQTEPDKIVAAEVTVPEKVVTEPVIVDVADAATDSAKSTAAEPALKQVADDIAESDTTALTNSDNISDDLSNSAKPELSDDLLLQILDNMPLIAANIFALLLVMFLVTSWLGYNLPGFKGVFAEYKLNRLLRWRLSGRYQHFRKLKLLTEKNELTEIDHLVLCPFGIFVIAVRSDRGYIYGSETEANWTRQYFGRIKHLMNPLHQNFKNVEAVKQFLQLKNTEAVQQLYSVIAFSKVAHFRTEMPNNVMYVNAVSGYLKQFNEPCLTEDQLNRFSALLQQASTAR